MALNSPFFEGIIIEGKDISGRKVWSTRDTTIAEDVNDAACLYINDWKIIKKDRMESLTSVYRLLSSRNGACVQTQIMAYFGETLPLINWTCDNCCCCQLLKK